jgi:hypothetical protein
VWCGVAAEALPQLRAGVEEEEAERRPEAVTDHGRTHGNRAAGSG